MIFLKKIYYYYYYYYYIFYLYLHWKFDRWLIWFTYLTIDYDLTDQTIPSLMPLGFTVVLRLYNCLLENWLMLKS